MPPLISSVAVSYVETRTESKIEFLKYSPLLPTAVKENVSTTYYRTGTDQSSPFAIIPPPVPVGSATPVDLTTPVPLVATGVFHQCEPIFVRVTDLSRNIDPSLTETAVVTISNPANGDVEVLRLTETGPTTGVFLGYIQTTGTACGQNPPPIPYSGSLPVGEAAKITATYADSLSSTAIVDPFGILFNSVTGMPVDGVTITLLDDSTGLPATVYGDDGVSAFPATVTTGGTATDSTGRIYSYPPGQFRFPFVNPGTYRFQIESLPGYSKPSSVSIATLQALPGAPFAVVAGSRLEPFVINPGPALHIDIPIDPLPASLWLQKSAGKSTVAIGDFLPYQLDVQNNHDTVTAVDVTIVDTLPPGFRYKAGSTTILGQPAADPAISADGRTLTYSLSDLPPKGAVKVRLMVEVAAGARVGAATNIATAHSYATTSNTARATVQVQSDFLNSRSLIMGRVGRGPCNLDWDEGVEGVRIYLEDGSFVNTDKRGMFHFEGVRPGSHVVQLDLDSLPEGFEVYSCEENTRFAGRSFSQFIDLQGGTMWRADFRVGRPDDVALYEKQLSDRLDAERRAIEAANKLAKERMLKEEQARKAAEASAREKEAAEIPESPSQAFPATAPAEEVEEPPVDDWAEPVPVLTEQRGEKGIGGEPAKPMDAASPAIPDVASLELRSSLEQDVVIFTPSIEVSQALRQTQRLEVELPTGLSFRPGSATRDGQTLIDPKIDGRTLTFALPPLAQGSKTTLRFAADFAADAPSGEYITRAVLVYATEQGVMARTMYADNVLVRIKEEERDTLPAMVVRPKFETFKDKLSAEDNNILDEAVKTIKSLIQSGNVRVRQLLLVGHTDNVGIARRSRHIHQDNMALSIARARSVASYLKEQLGLTPAQVSASGKGDTSPVASNRTTKGRALNRHVEVIILTEQVVERAKTRIKKDKSVVRLGRTGTAPAETSGQSLAAGSGAIIPASTHEVSPVKGVTADGLDIAAAPDAEGAGELLPRSAMPSSGKAVGAEAEPQPRVGTESPEAEPTVGASSTAPLVHPAADSHGKEPVKEDPGLTEVGIVSPADGTALPDPISAVRVILNSNLAPQLLVDGTEVPADRIGFTFRDSKSEKTLYSYIGVDFGEPGIHTITLLGKDPFGIVRLEKTAKIIRVGAISLIRFAGAEGNVADGKTPVRMKFELFDSAGVPFRSATELLILGGTLKPLRTENLFPDAVQDKVERVQVDKDGFALFQPVSASGLYRTVLGTGKTAVEAEAYVQPKMRDWILVGLAEGTVGYNTVSGNMEDRGAGTDDNLYENGRLAFYGKGTIKGKWLMTLAYDTGKARGDGANSLFQTINPESYYTLYGDASQQQYDAASARKLYVKIERDQFYALFGDFETGLTVTELSRYSRRLNGAKAEWQSENFEATVFGAETAQAYARDELRGDGTSGLYRLSKKNIVINSEKITIQIRDRFRSELVLDSRIMSRYADYSIDYDTGAIFFKEPIASRDGQFNPIFIVAEYETVNAETEALTYGGRIGAKLLANRLRTGFTYIHEGQISGEGNSYGLDAAYKLGADTTLKGEAALTNTDFGGTTREGTAWLAELQHQTPRTQGRLYYKEQDEEFGLGQQNGSETGTRKFGVDASYKLTDAMSLGALGYRQYNLATDAVQDVVEAKATGTAGPYSGHLGLRHASDRLGDGSVQTSEQLTIGGSWLTLNKLLTLRAEHDQSIGGNSNVSFPTRTILGADFELTRKVLLFAQQEFTNGTGAKTDMTRLGFKSTPWEGGALNSTVERDVNENGNRLFALFGLKQTWRVTDKWSVDAGLDRSQTIKNARNYSFNSNVPPASGATEDFTAVSLGSTFTEKKWNWNNRLEFRSSDSEDKWGIFSAYVGEPREGWGWSGRIQLFDTESSANGTTTNADLRLGLVYRPPRTSWIILDRLDLVYGKQDGPACNTESHRIVNNLSANYKLDRDMQIFLQYGAKYVVETLENKQYSGFTDVAGLEGTYNVTKAWDISFRGSLLHSWNAGQLDYSAGPSIGFNVMENAWVSLGYNVVGFTDKDFSAANYTAQGPFVKMRFKFDQNSVRDAAKWLSL